MTTGRRLIRSLHLPPSEMESARNEFFAGDIVDIELLDYIRALRPRYRTGLISNAWDGLRPYMEREKFADAFDVLTISAEVGFMKPEAAIFQHALEQLEVKPGQAVFVDDFAENIAGCEAVGMRGILFRTVEQTLKELKKILK